MNTRLFSAIVLFTLSLSFFPHTIVAVRTRARRQNQHTANTKVNAEDKNPTIDQSIIKLFRLKWSKLNKNDAANFAKLGLTVGGIYVFFRYGDVLARIFDYRNISPDYMYELSRNNRQAAHYDETWLDQEEEQERECITCWENFRLANRYRLTCGHNNNCGDCLRAHVRAHASEGNITHIFCPHTDKGNQNCDHMLTPQEMINIANGDQRILSDARQAIENGPRNLALQTVPNLRACHVCPALFIYRGRSVIHCPGCHAVYCAHCREEHNGNVRSCATPNENIIKRCARCGSQVQKNGGCNHMTCTQCSYNYCWVCLSPFGGRDGVCQSYHCNVYRPYNQNFNWQI